MIHNNKAASPDGKSNGMTLINDPESNIVVFRNEEILRFLCDMRTVTWALHLIMRALFYAVVYDSCSQQR